MSSPQYRDSAGARDRPDRHGRPGPAPNRRPGGRPNGRPGTPVATIVTGSRRGLTVLGAALIALVGGGVGAIFDLVIFHHLSALFAIGFVIGCLAAASRVHEDDLVTVVIMPPLVYALITGLVGLLYPPDGGSGPGLKNKAIDVGSELVFRAPAVIAAVGVVIVVAALRARRVRLERQERERLVAAGERPRRRPPL